MNNDTNPHPETLASKITSASLKTAPFAYIHHENVFPISFYNDILKHLPATRFYRELKDPDALQPDGKSARLSFNLFPESLRQLPLSQRTFWMNFIHHMTSRDVETAFKTKFKKTLEEHNQKKLERIKIRPRPMLFRDIAGYRISIHPDTPRKAITTQYYLPADDTQEHSGTVLHERLPDGAFAESTTLPFRPNTGYAFAVTKESWHSEKLMIGGDGKTRNSLMVIYYYDQGAIIEGLKVMGRGLRAVANNFSPGLRTERPSG